MAQARGLVWLRQDYGAELIQDGVYTELEVDEARGGLIIYHGVMLKVELIEGLWRKSIESRSLFSWEKRVTCSLDWSPVV